MKSSKDPSHIKAATSRPGRVTAIPRAAAEGGGRGGGGGGGEGGGSKSRKKGAQTAADFKDGNQPSKVIIDRGSKK